MESSVNFKADVLDVLKSVMFATLISLGLVLVFAMLIKFASLPTKVIMPINIAIKLLSILLGVFIGFKNLRGGLVKGAVSGLIYMLFTFFIFAALTAFKDVNFSWIDLLTMPVAGAISGIATVNIKAHKRSH